MSQHYLVSNSVLKEKEIFKKRKAKLTSTLQKKYQSNQNQRRGRDCYLQSYCYNFFLSFFFGHVAYGILVPPAGIKPEPPALEVWSLNHWTRGDPTVRVSNWQK